MCLCRSWSWSVTNVPTSRCSSDLIGPMIRSVLRSPPLSKHLFGSRPQTVDKPNTSRLILLKLKQAGKTAISCWSNSKDLDSALANIHIKWELLTLYFPAEMTWLVYTRRGMSLQRIFYAQQCRTPDIAHLDFMVKQLFNTLPFFQRLFILYLRSSWSRALTHHEAAHKKLCSLEC